MILRCVVEHVKAQNWTAIVPDTPQKNIDAAARLLRNNADLAPALRLRIATLESQLSDLKENNQVTINFNQLSEEARQ